MYIKEVIKETRKAATSVGITFRAKNARLNGGRLYCFIDKRRGDIAMDNCTLASAYNNVCSGFIDSFDKETGYFNGSIE